MSNMDRVITTEIFVNGESRPASDGAVYDIFNPARPSELVGHAAAATENHDYVKSWGMANRAAREAAE